MAKRKRKKFPEKAVKRKKRAAQRKNKTLYVVSAIFLWLLSALFVYFFDPDSFAAIPIFLTLIFFVLLTTIRATLSTPRHAYMIAVAFTLFLVLRYLGIGNIINLFLIAGVAVAIEFFFVYY